MIAGAQVGRGSIITRLRAAGCVFPEREAALLCDHSGRVGADLEQMVAERESGRPLEYVLGWAAFGGLRIPVTDGVFVPRPRSGLLVRLAASQARIAASRSAGVLPVVVVDLCCGAGGLGAVLASQVPGVHLHSADIDPAAVDCARRATEPFGGMTYVGDLFEALPRPLRGQVDVLVANAPYVPTGEIGFLPAEARDFERRAALDGGTDGLAVLRRVAAGARAWLAQGGVVLVECATHQATALSALVAAAGLGTTTTRDSDLGATVITGSMR